MRRKGLRRAIALLATVTTAASLLAGCGGSSSSSTAASTAASGASSTAGGTVNAKDTLVIGSQSEISSLDLLNNDDQINNICFKLTHETLLHFPNDGTGKMTGELAKSYEWTDDTTLRYVLKDGITFSDGSPMTADDVKYTYDCLMDPNKSSLGSYVSGLKSVEVIDDKTIDFHLTEHMAEWPINTANYPGGVIISKKAYESGEKEPYLIGSGPYVFKEWVSGDHVTFVRNDNYWDKENAGVAKEITFRFMSEDSTRVIAMENHEIDVCIKPPTNEIDNLKNAQGVTVENKVSTRKHYLGFNLNSDFFKNQTLRQAVACAINRDDINAAAYDGNGAVQYTDLNRGLPTFDESIGSYKYDLTRAKELMKEAGYENGFTCNLYVASDEQWPTMASVVQAQLKEIGITVNIVETETATHKSIIKEGVDSSTGNTVDMFIWRWNEDMKLDYVYGDLYSWTSDDDHGSANFYHLKDDKVNSLRWDILTSEDDATYQSKSVELQKYLDELQPEVVFCTEPFYIAYDSNLKGAYLFTGGNHDWSHAYVATS
ncbi:MAG: ABC transporter substrate-binding protein [Lachnospiraceae bacterium]|jgi:peptide/nickel transport system substrate-binding protein|nr:ABC transporter substrate-binding protein [Lachnospiraceae bacterium]MCI1727180.1 ABC transporter substrate-binding protein [Lachnospiraceae bacterium]